jgi:predicted alpha/beta superfamily hydrolase
MNEGTIQIIADFDMPQLKRKRNIRIYLPPNYTESKRRYGVLYMQDGQNLFDPKDSAFGSIWDIKTTLEQRHLTHTEDDIIVVGIDNGSRYRYAEYSPWKSEIGTYYLPHAKATSMPGGDGFDYMSFMVKTLKPFIDQQYRTLPSRDHTAIAGSSMGGLISICTAIRYQNIFSKVAAFSSAFYFAEKEVLDLIHKEGKKAAMRFYLDVGTNETSNPTIIDFPQVYVDVSKHIYESLISVGFTSNEVKFEAFEDDIHHEKCWARRFPFMLDWLYQK